MSWFTSKPAAAPSRTTVRQQEIGIFQRTIRDLQWVAPDETCLKVFQISNYQLTLSIHVPQNYPDKPPVLRLLTPASHPWLDQQGFLSQCPAVVNWNPSSPSLVSLIQFIEHKFQQQPPIPTQQIAPQPQQPGQYTNLYNSSTNPYQAQPPPQGDLNCTGTYNSQYQPPSSSQLQQSQLQQSQLQQSQHPPTPHRPSHSSYQPPTSSQPNTPQNSAMNQSNAFLPQQSMSQSTTNAPQLSPTPSEPPQSQPQSQKPTLQFKHTNLPKPSLQQSQQQQPPERPISLAPIPPRPNFDRNQLSKLSIAQLEELDKDPNQIKRWLARDSTLSAMYESDITLSYEVDELKALETAGANGEDIETMEIVFEGLLGEVKCREGELNELKVKYEEVLLKHDIHTYIKNLENHINDLDDQCDELTSSMSGKRTTDEDGLLDFLDKYEKIRKEYHVKSIILQKLKKSVGAK